MKTPFISWAVAVTTAVALGTAAWAASDTSADAGGPPPPPPDTQDAGGPPPPPPHDRGPRGPGGPGGPGAAEDDFKFLHGPIAAALGITDDQRNQIKTILETAAPTVKPLMQSMMQARETLRTVIQTSPVNETAIRTQSAAVAAIEANLAVQRANIFQKVKAVLTPDQVQRLQQVQASMEKRVGRGFGRFGRGQRGDRGERGANQPT